MTDASTDDSPDEDEPFPDEQKVIAERGEDLYTLDDEAGLSVKELAEDLNIELE